MTDNTNTPPVPPVNPPPGSTKPSDSAIPIPVNSAGISSKSDMAEIVSDRMDRFGDVLAAMSDQLARHTLFLAEMVDLSKTQIQMEIENQRLADLRAKDGNEARPVVLPNGNTVNPVAGGGQAEEKGLLATLLGGAGGFLATAVSAYALRMLGKAGLVAFFAPIIGRWVTEFVTTFAEETGFSKEFAKGLGDAMGDFSLGALVGSIFGKRMALIFGLANMGAGLADDILDALGLNKDQILLKLGEHEFSLGDITTGIFGAITGGLALYVTSGAFMAKIANLWKTTDVVAGEPSKFGKFGKFMKGAGLAAVAAGVVSGLFMAYGESISEWLSDTTGIPKDWTNVAVDSLNGMFTGIALGSMFGPTGMLIGAIAGLAYVAGKALYDWISDERQKAMEKLSEDVSKMSDEDLSRIAEGDVQFISDKLKGTAGVADEDLREVAAAEQIKRAGGIKNVPKPGAKYDLAVKPFDDLTLKDAISREELDALYMNWETNKDSMTAEERNALANKILAARLAAQDIIESAPPGPGDPGYNAEKWAAYTQSANYHTREQLLRNGISEDLDTFINELTESGAFSGAPSNAEILKLGIPTQAQAAEYIAEKSASNSAGGIMVVSPVTVNNVNNTGGNSVSNTTTFVGGHSPALDGPGYANPGGR